ncbi:hypothetical protein D3C75_1042490 [compost metagenome]
MGGGLDVLADFQVLAQVRIGVSQAIRGHGIEDSQLVDMGLARRNQEFPGRLSLTIEFRHAALDKFVGQRSGL